MPLLSAVESLPLPATTAKQAKRYKEDRRVAPADRPGITASAFQLGQTYGVGVG